MNGQVASVLERLRTGYWLVPGLMTAGAIGLAEVMLSADEARPDMLVAATSWFAVPGAEGSRAVLAAIAGSMVTVAATVFSITMLTLSSASQQFGPRVLRNFTRDRWNQITLGVFTGTFVYALLVLRTAGRSKGEEFVPHLSVSVAMALALAAVGVLVVFIHHVSTQIQAAHIVARIADDLNDQIDAFFPEAMGESAGEPPSAAIPPDAPRVCCFQSAGYVEAITNAALRAAEQHGLTVRLLVRPGEFVTIGEPCAHAWPAESVTREIEHQIIEGCILNDQRTAAQDPEFAVGQLAQLGARALSSGINDPFTAAACIDHLSAGLVRLAGRGLPSEVRTGKDGNGRVIAPGPSFKSMLESGFAPIREYGASHTIIVRRMALALRRIAAAAVRSEDRLIVHAELELLMRSAEQALGHTPHWPRLKAELAKPDPQGGALFANP